MKTCHHLHESKFFICAKCIYCILRSENAASLISNHAISIYRQGVADGRITMHHIDDTDIDSFIDQAAALPDLQSPLDPHHLKTAFDNATAQYPNLVLWAHATISAVQQGIIKLDTDIKKSLRSIADSILFRSRLLCGGRRPAPARAHRSCDHTDNQSDNQSQTQPQAQTDHQPPAHPLAQTDNQHQPQPTAHHQSHPLAQTTDIAQLQSTIADLQSTVSDLNARNSILSDSNDKLTSQLVNSGRRLYHANAVIDTVEFSLSDPVNLAPIKDPVVTPSGHIYDRTTLSNWFATCTTTGIQPTDPLSGQDIHPSSVSQSVPNLKDMLTSLKAYRDRFPKPASS